MHVLGVSRGTFQSSARFGGQGCSSTACPLLCQECCKSQWVHYFAISSRCFPQSFFVEEMGLAVPGELATESLWQPSFFWLCSVKIVLLKRRFIRESRSMLKRRVLLVSQISARNCQILGTSRQSCNVSGPQLVQPVHAVRS